MDKDLEQKEIRSNKVRSIMAEEPPFVIRNGTFIIAIILFVITWAIYLILKTISLLSR